VGDHIRPRVAVPESWKWPVGVSLSAEFGYQRAVYSPDTFTPEIRPIVDKTLGRFYLCFNPVLDRSFHGGLRILWRGGANHGIRSAAAATAADFRRDGPEREPEMGVNR